MKTILVMVGTFIAVVAIGVGLYFGVVYGGGAAQRSTADYRGQTSAIEKLKANGDYRIQVYDHFFDQCAAVQTAEARLKAQQDLLKETTDAQRRAEIQANIAAITSSRAEQINQYNADSAKDFTEAAFKSIKLPFRLDVNDKDTQCDL